MTDDRTIPLETISRMIAAIEPDATVREATPAESGHLPVYQLVVETPGGSRDWVLKASPDGDRHGIDTEARLLALVDDRTSIPVPAVVGAVDSHPTLPAPFFVMETVAGERIPKRRIGELSGPVVERLARGTGRYLAELHELDGPAGYGQVDIAQSQSLDGDRPSVGATQLTVTDLQGRSDVASAEWPAVVRRWTEDALERHESTRFGDLTGEIRPTIRDRLESLDGPFDPVLGRIDHGLHNVLLDPETGALTGVIDWAFTLSVPPIYDLGCVAANLSLGPWSIHPSAPDRRRAIREALLEGYRAGGRTVDVDRYHRHRSAYELLALVRAMNHLDLVTDMAMPGATAAQVDEAAAAYRRLLRERLG
ncbi:phosphotransferase family protein [Halovivax limisalsi]|uniref:phosphotransferase family protein n=1 Tax=Halovivax limisalsi TaxID=1453760 RepID=UPI001FFDA3A7|nr:phosphotransferase [Halovivax limisalsi]